jgi:hypothetical protein
MKQVTRKTWACTVVDIKEIVREVVDGVNLAQDRDNW